MAETFVTGRETPEGRGVEDKKVNRDVEPE